MKKMLSVLLALVMILCACAPAFATEAAATFPFAAESYNTMFETLVAVSAQATCETVKADDVTYVITNRGRIYEHFTGRSLTEKRRLH